MRVGVLSTGCLLVFFGECFQNTPMLTRSWGLLFFCCGTFILWSLVDIFVPPSDGVAELMLDRRSRVERAVLHVGINMQTDLPTGANSQSELGTNAVDTANWSALPCLEDPYSGEDSFDED